jgi:FixJ family two-component response regulator
MTAQASNFSNVNSVVYIVDDDKAIRESLAWLLKCNGFKASCHESAERFLHALSSSNPSDLACILLDINLSGISGLELQKRLLEEGYKIPIAFLTGHGDISQAVQALKQGAHDFIQKPFDGNGLCNIIDEMLKKSSNTKKHEEEIKSTQSKFRSLTSRENDVLECIVEGCTNKETADRLNISLKTVEAHRSSIMDKVGVNRAATLLKLAIALNHN